MHAQTKTALNAISGGHNPLMAFPGGWEHHRDRHCIWIVSPKGYVHSRAFDEVALGLHFAFAELGGRAPLVTEPSNWNGRIPIVFGANLLPANAANWLPKGTILVNLEQVSTESSWINGAYVGLLRQFPVLDYSPKNRDELYRLGIAHAGLLRVGYSRGLTRIVHAPVKEFDVLFYGSMNERRRDVLLALREAGLNVGILFGVYGEERDAAIARCKMVINIHHFAAQVFEIVRVSYLLANRVCVLTEGQVGDPDLAPYAGGLASAAYDELVARCLSLVANDDERNLLATTGFEIMGGISQAAILRETIGR
jgi:hypothetical protein